MTEPGVPSPQVPLTVQVNGTDLLWALFFTTIDGNYTRGVVARLAAALGLDLADVRASNMATIRSRPAVEDAGDAEGLARLFHETYERLAPVHGYESVVPWNSDNDRALMIDVARAVLASFDGKARIHDAWVTIAAMHTLFDDMDVPVDGYYARLDTEEFEKARG